jgi:predicted enzyme related to lactoylglutathione lyase
MIKAIAFTVYPVKDVARARTFYEGALGLKVAEQFGDGWIEYDVGGATFAITNNFENPHPSSSVAFEVDDLDKYVESLQAAGVLMQGEVGDYPSCRMALINDPDGSTICIHQKKSA